MSQQYDNTNRGVLFDNDRKETDNHPDMTGSINIAGVEHWFSGWWKNGSKGEFLSLSIGKPKDQQQARQQPAQPPAPVRRGNRPSGNVQPVRGNSRPPQDYQDDGDPIPF